ncbi:Uncharacterised protein [uncultured archaeon]|nr:Uncharacterised protein [uncultured archaeon]
MAKKSSKSSNNVLAAITHILGIFISFIGALVVYIAVDNKEVKNHAKNALNWQISLIIYSIISIILIIVIIGIVLLVLLGILNVIFCIIAAIKASDGKLWEYPLTIKFLK